MYFLSQAEIISFLDSDPVCTCGGDTPGSQIYKPDFDSDCTRFTQYIEPGEPSDIFIDCPAGLIFDIVSCSCNWRYAASCNSECKGTLLCF